MFLRTVKAAGGQGVQHEYVRLVEAYREDGRAKQRVVCNLGRKDLLAAHLDALIRLLRGEPVRRAAVRLGEVQAPGAWDWGPMLVARALWRELGLDAILDGQGGRGPGDGRALADRALVLVANRLCAPTSEHGLARWLETDFVCDRQGRRWRPAWRGDAERRAGRVARGRGAAAPPPPNQRGGTGPPIGGPRKSRSSSRNSICGCAISFRSRSTSRSTT